MIPPAAAPVAGFLNELRGLGVKLWLDGERLRFRAPRGVLSDELHGRMRAHKAELLGFLREVRKAQATAAPEIERIDRSTFQGRFPLSFSQERLWFIEQWRPEGVAAAAYNVTDVVSLRGRLDAGALERSLGEIVRRHEVLRTTFHAPDGQPVQVVDGEPALPLPLIDLGLLPAARRAGRRLELVDAIAHRPFDLVHGPLVRAFLLRLDGDEHLLVVSMHHIASDGWSTGVLVRELAALYLAFTDGAASPLPPLEVQYADFAVWQRRWLESAALDGQMAFWKKRLAGAEGVLDLPADRPRPPVQTFRGATCHFTLPAALATGLERLEERGTTRFMILLAAFATLLERYAATDDVLIGTPVANRRRSELEGLIGFFVNTLVIRAELEGDPSFQTLLERVRDSALEAFAHQDVPFEKLVEELEPRRDTSRSPLFQVLFAHQNAPLPSMEIPGLTLEPVLLENRTAKFDLSLMVSDSGPTLSAALEYSTDLFDATTMARLAGHYRHLLQSAVEGRERRLTELPWLSAGERHQLVREWRDAAGVAITAATLHELFRSQAERTPEATSLVCGDRQLTYGELRRRANRLAHHLRGLGVGPEVRVGLCLDRDPDMVVGLLGILAAGGTYVPLDAAYPPERLRFMVEDSGVEVLLTQEKLVDSLPCIDVSTALLDADRDAIAGHGAADPPAVSGKGHLAYVIYTSGSTGRPKGVAIEHRSAVALVHWARRVFPAADLAGVAATTSICFDLSVFELFVPLSWGGRVILFDDALALASDAGTAAVRLVNTVPSAAAELLRLGALPPSVGSVNLAGEPVKGALVAELYRHPPVRRVYNLYGPSEDTTYSTFGLVPPGSFEPTIGRPVAATEAWVLDRRGLPLPIGVPGELHLGGSGLARCYLGRAARTAASFVPRPASGGPGARLYRSGDRVRHLPDGELAFLGRLDRQVKVRGFRIELGEVEVALGKHPGVRDNVVHLWQAPAAPNRPSDPRLVGYLVPDGDRPPTAEQLRAFLARTLPEYMVPSAFVRLDRLPLTPTGKVDRRALPAPELGQAAGDGAVAPRTSLEEGLAAIWREVLGLDALGVYDDFFKLGGHSLLATRIVARIGRSLGVALPVRQIFETPTVARLAEHVGAALASGEHATLPPLEPAPRDQPLALSHAQERLWLFEQLNPGTAVYTTSRAGHLRGPLHVLAVEAILNEVLRRHEALRTRFVAGPDGQPRQVVEAHRRRRLPVVDLEALPGARSSGEALALGLRESRTPFDLTRAPLLRAVLMRLSPEEHVVSLSIHHICFDLWSGNVLLQELEALYPATVEGRPSPLPELAFQYPDFAFWQRRWLTSDVLDDQLAYWRHRLGGVSPMTLPSDRPRPPVERFHGKTYSFRVERQLTEGLTRLGRSESVTQFIAFMAIFKALLFRSTRQRRVIVSTAISNRHGAELDKVIGFFDNLILLATETAGAGGWSLRRLLAEVRETALGAYSHQHVSFERVLRELRPERDHNRTPLVQAVFILELNHPAMARRIAGLEMNPYQLDLETSKFDLTLSLRDAAEGGLIGQLNYNSDLFDGTTIARFAGHYRELLASLLAEPDRPLAELTLLRPAERWQLRGEWNDTAGAGAVTALAHERVVAQACRRPMAVAVAGDGEAWTYGELEERSERLARRLRRLGVGPDVRVGVCAERSPAMIAALLAVWKAGGAYMPLDPAYPPARLAFILGDARAPVLITEAHLAALIQPEAGAVVLLDTAWDEVDEEAGVAADGAAATQAEGDNLAYVIYTSGSTGRPKGVEICHRTLLNLTAWHQRAFAVTAADRATQLAGLAFDASVWEIWPYLTLGATLHLPDEALHADPERLRDWLLARRVTVSFLPTPLAESVLTLDWPRRAPLRLLLTGGDRLHQPPATGLPFELVNNYGPTENTVVATSGTVAPRAAAGAPGRAPSIGRAIDNVTAYVVDESLEPLPVSHPGELLIGGASLARGYRPRPPGGKTRPAWTAERFVPDVLSGVAGGGRLYRTGDLVRLLYDGTIDFLGRIDNQVKVRGFRIELGEIEAALARHPCVEAAAVLAPEAPDGTRYLVAFMVPAEGAAITAEELEADLAESLPEFMVPAVMKTLDSLPLTPNGKVDRKALEGRVTPELDERTAELTAPRDRLELELLRIWEELLGVRPSGIRDVLARPRLSVLDDFFELGGHSLLATQVISRVRLAFEVNLPVRELFEARTVRGLATRLEEALGQRKASAIPPIVPVSRDDNLPLSFAQQRMWFIDQLEPGTPVYNVALALGIDGPLRDDVLEASLREVVHRHEALRTVFAKVEGEPIQVILPDASIDLPVIDLTGLPASRREAVAKALSAEEEATPFDLAHGPLLRARLLRLAEREHVALLTMHHIVSDGWSMGILVDEVTVLYQAFADGRPSPLSKLEVQYADYAVGQRRWLEGEQLAEQLDYWRAELEGTSPVLELPTDRPRPPIQTNHGATRMLRLSAELSEQVETLARRAGATLFMTALVPFAAVLSRYTEEEDFLLGSPIANRNRAEIEGLIGFFVNTLILRMDVSGDPSFGEQLARVRRSTLDAYAHQDLPFERLVDELRIERSLDRSPLFQVMFVLQNAPVGNPDVPGLGFRALPSESRRAAFDWTLEVTRADAGIEVFLEYNTVLFDSVTAIRALRHFERALSAFVDDPGRRLGEADLFGDAERHQLAVEWNDAPRDAAPEAGFQQLFEDRVATVPDGLALIDAATGESLTYRELDRRADLLARLLRQQGVGVESRVGLLMERSVEMVVGILAVLKAGGAYVPLDPAYPRQRRELMARDARITVLLTHRGLEAEQSHDRVVFADHAVSMADGERSGRAPAVSPEQAAYVIYTSGSTGRPKGVVISHRALAAYIAAAVDAYGMRPDERVLQFSSINFDLSVGEVYPCFALGATLVLRDAAFAESATEFFRRSRDRSVSFVILPTPFWHELVSAVEDDPELLPPSLHLVVVAGDRLLPEKVATWKRCVPGCPHLVNSYGPTETTVVVTAVDLTVPRRVTTEAEVPIGRPLSDTRLFVVDRRLTNTPSRIAGELVIGGECVARGYLDRPAVTADRFVPDPWSDVPGARLFKSGDRVRYRADGALKFLERIDGQVKVRGFRVELGEIESALCRHPGVDEAIVITRMARGGNKSLAAFLLANEPLTPPELQRFLGADLPEHMVPQELHFLETWPMMPNGKVDRQALLQIEPARQASGIVAARDSLELDLVRIWEKMLDHQPIGVRDSFFEIGGHSLMAVSLFHRVEQQFGCRLSLEILFQVPTIERLASEIRRRGSAPERSLLVEIRAGTRRPPLVLVHPVGGHVLCYADLARHLGAGQPVYGLRARGLEGREQPLGQIEAMADEYLAELDARLPAQPFVLGGWSMGGLVAWEMANRLSERGREVDSLLLLDTWALKPEIEMDGMDEETMLLAHFATDLGLRLDALGTDQARELSSMNHDEQMSGLLGHVKALGLVPPDFERSQLTCLYHVFKIHVQASDAYRPEPAARRTVLVKASGAAGEPPRESGLGWRGLAPALEIHEVGADHHSMIREPAVQEVARIIRHTLRGE